MAVETDMFDLSGTVALVTGGAGAIGREIAGAMASHGASVFIGSRTRSNVDQVVEELKHRFGEARILGTTIDVTRDASVEHAFQSILDELGQIDILVNCAGVQLKKPTLDLTPDEFNRMFDLHATGTLRCAQAAARHFIPRKGGCIVNITSVAAFADLHQVAAYTAAKNAVVGLTRSFANEWATYGIRTNAIAPGFIPTEMNRHNIEGNDRGRRIIEGTPAGRFGRPEEIAGTAVYLASPAAEFVNGQTIVVDGGFVACGFGDQFAPWKMTNDEIPGCAMTNDGFAMTNDEIPNDERSPKSD